MERYTKNEFNKLTIDLQVKFFNSKLDLGCKITDICKDIGISYNTVRDRFLRANYVFNKSIKQYENAANIFPYDNDEIERALEKIVFNIYNKNNNTFVPEKMVCNIEGNVINRSFRIYDNVLEEFTEFCKNSNYSQYDILSTFILEGLSKYSSVY